MKRSFAIVSLAFALTGCGNWHEGNRRLDEKTFDSAALAMVQKETGIDLPDGSRGLRMFYDGTSSIDPSFVAKIQIPEASGDELAKRIEQIRNHDGTVSSSLADKVTWWTPSNGVIRVQRQFNPRGDYIRAILSQETNQLVLYVEWVKI
jgi:hypothetical protein